MLRIAILIAPLLAAGCARDAAVRSPAAVSAPNWKRIATPADLTRLRGWRDAFVAGLRQARESGHAGEVAREGALLVPDAAIEPVALAAGDYRCRVIKLGSGGSGGGPSYVPYPAFDCRIDGNGATMRFAKLTGSQRHIGRLYDDGLARRIFLGTMVLGDETRAFGYATDAQRDVAGAVQRIGPARWRMLIPYPRFESVIDVIELAPKN